jgi:hypothetical protein
MSFPISIFNSLIYIKNNFFGRTKSFLKRKSHAGMLPAKLVLFRKCGVTYLGLPGGNLYFFLYICRKKK